MMRVGTPHYNFDSTNAQEPFTYMARIIGTNEIAVGYVVVVKAAYCPKNTWKYYIEYNDYRSYGCGVESAYLGLKRVAIDPDTIVPYNQLARIKVDQEHGYDILLEGNDLPGLRTSLKIAHNEKIPEGLYAPISEEYAARYEKYGACSEVTPEQNVIEDVIENSKILERVKLLEVIKKFWDEHKKDYKTVFVLVGVGYCKEDCETIEERVPGIFTHSLTSMYFEDMDACIEDFVKCVDPEDVGAFDCGTRRKEQDVSN